jgi:hypothetical protein
MSATVFRNPRTGYVEFWLSRGDFAAKPLPPLEWEHVEPGASREPTFSLSPVDAQALAEGLSAQGIRTDNDAKIAGTLEATRAHLADLRALLKEYLTMGVRRP